MQKILTILSLVTILACASKYGKTWLKNKADWVEESAARPYSIQVDDTVTRKGVPSLRFELRKTEGFDSGRAFTFRSQISTEVFPPKFSERWYACSFLLPRNFPIEDNRLVLMDWWSLTKREHKEAGKPPALSVHFTDGRFHVNLRHTDMPVVHDPEAVPLVPLFQTRSLKLDVWQDLLFHVKWSPQKDGFVHMWLNGRQVADYDGPIGYDDPEAPLFRFGLYRDDSEATYVAYFSECRQGKTKTEVMPKE